MVSKRLVYLIAILIIPGIILSFLWLRPSQTFAAGFTITGDDLGLTLNTTDPLFSVANMAPGFRDAAEVTVTNSGQYDFSYAVSARLNNDDRTLFDWLIIEVKDSAGNIQYVGVMGGLEQEVDLGTLPPGGSHKYMLEVYFPVESGNEFQGKYANVDFVFHARGYQHGIEPGTVAVFEPPFSNKNFALRMKSTVPIKFHLVKPDGNYDIVVRDVKLVISGPDAGGSPQEIVFGQSDGTLKFIGNGNKPHYMAQLSSLDYSLRVGGQYTAAVVHGNTVLATRDFTVDDASGTSRSNSP